MIIVQRAANLLKESKVESRISKSIILIINLSVYHLLFYKIISYIIISIIFHYRNIFSTCSQKTAGCRDAALPGGNFAAARYC